MILTHRIGMASIGVLLGLGLALLIVATSGTASAYNASETPAVDAPAALAVDAPEIALSLAAPELAQPVTAPAAPYWAARWWQGVGFGEFIAPQAGFFYCLLHATAAYGNRFYETTWEHEFDICRKY